MKLIMSLANRCMLEHKRFGRSADNTYSRRYGPEHLVVQTENPEAEILCKLRDFFITTSKRKQLTPLGKGIP